MKLRYSPNGRIYSGTWHVTQQDNVFTAVFHLEISRGEEVKKLRFITQDEMNRFDKGISMCRVTDEEGIECYVGGFGKGLLTKKQ
jgi:hypothetical protein